MGFHVSLPSRPHHLVRSQQATTTMSAQWQHGLFGCFDNCGLCVMAYFCPCIVFGRTAEKVGESCGMCGFCIMMPIGNIISWMKIRGKVREAKGIEGSTCHDILMLCFCGMCALVQTAHEMEDAAPPAMIYSCCASVECARWCKQLMKWKTQRHLPVAWTGNSVVPPLKTNL